MTSLRQYSAWQSHTDKEKLKQNSRIMASNESFNHKTWNSFTIITGSMMENINAKAYVRFCGT